MTSGVRQVLLNPPFNPYRLANNAAVYSLDGEAGDSTYKIDGSNRLQLVADRSGNSAVNGLVLNGVSGNYASTPDSAALDITGDIDLRFQVSILAASLSSSTSYILGAKLQTATTRSYFVELAYAPAGVVGDTAIRLTTSSAGTSGTQTATLSDVGINSLLTGTPIWFRITRDVDNGASGNTTTYYTSTDGGTWTQYGAAKTVAGVISIFSSTSQYEIGAALAGTSENLPGIIHRAQVYNGIAGTLAFDANFTAVAKLASSFTESSSNAATVTINTTGDTGARISGARDLYQGTQSKQPIFQSYGGTPYLYLNGATGNYASSPDSAAVSVTGDIDIRVLVQLPSYTPSALTTLVAKYTTTGNQRSYWFRLNTDGTLQFVHSNDGVTGTIVANLSPVLGFSAYSTKWLRVTRVQSTGVCTCYSSDDGVTWTAYTAEAQASNAGQAIFDSTAILEIGAAAVGTLNPLNGYVYRAQIYNGIAGTLAFDANFSTFVSGRTFTESSSNAATVTLNGAAAVITGRCAWLDGTDDYIRSPSFSFSQPESGYFVGSHVTWTGSDKFFDGTAVGNRMALFQSGSSPTIALFAGSTSPGVSALALGVRGVLRSVFNGASSSLGVNQSAATTGDAGASGGAGLTLGAQYDATAAGNITFSEVLLRSAADDTTTQTRIAGYEMRKWGVS